MREVRSEPSLAPARERVAHRARRLVVLLAAAAAAGPVPLAEAQSSRLAFVTSITGSARLRDWPEADGNVGIAAGDAVCRNLALAAGLPAPSEFVAWLSDTSTDAYCHVHGFDGKKSENCGQEVLPAFAGPWARVDRAPFAARIDQALEPYRKIYAPVLLDEHGAPASTTSYFSHTWRDGTLQGSLVPVPCDNWDLDSSDDYVVLGSAVRTGDGWTSYASTTCNNSRALLCLHRGSGPPWRPSGRAAPGSSSPSRPARAGCRIGPEPTEIQVPTGPTACVRRAPWPPGFPPPRATSAGSRTPLPTPRTGSPTPGRG